MKVDHQAALDAALLRELALTTTELRHNHFRDARLRPAALALSDTVRRLGAWERATRTISLSRALIYQQPWGAVREVLKHELAHQYVDEVLGIHDETAHGPAFTEVCRARGIDASAAGLPPSTGAAGPNPIVRRIMRLLALSSSANVHEAEAATNEARRLMLLHNIDAAVSVARGGFSFRHVGAVKARSDASARVLAGILGQHFFVSVIWVPSYLATQARRGHVLELCGTAANLDVAAYVHGFLTDTAERLWQAHKKANGIPSDRERRRFLAGVMMGVGEKLAAGERESRREGLRADLILRADAAREAYLQKRYPRRASRGVSLTRTESYEHGRAAGRDIDVRRPVPPASGPRLLPPRSI